MLWILLCSLSYFIEIFSKRFLNPLKYDLLKCLPQRKYNLRIFSDSIFARNKKNSFQKKVVAKQFHFDFVKIIIKIITIIFILSLSLHICIYNVSRRTILLPPTLPNAMCFVVGLGA